MARFLLLCLASLPRFAFSRVVYHVCLALPVFASCPCISRGASVFRVALQFFAWRFNFRVALQFFAWRLGCWRGVAPATTMDSAHKIEYVDYFILAVLPVVKHCIFKAFWRCRPM